MKKISIILLSAFLFTNADAVQSTARATQKVLASLRIQNLSDLNFGVAVQGDPGKTIQPGTADNGENASFLMTGEPHARVRINLPSSEIYMIHKDGKAKIRVSNFNSNPRGETALDPQGRSLILVGASREAIGAELPRGEYEGVFNVDIIYE